MQQPYPLLECITAIMESLIYEEGKPDCLYNKALKHLITIQQVFNNRQSQDKLKKECRNGRYEVCSSIMRMKTNILNSVAIVEIDIHVKN